MRKVGRVSVIRWVLARFTAFVQAPHHLVLIGFIIICELFYLGWDQFAIGLVAVIIGGIILFRLQQKVFILFLLIGGVFGYLRFSMVELERSKAEVFLHGLNVQNESISGWILREPKYDESSAKIVLRLENGVLVYTKVSNFPIKRIGMKCHGEGLLSAPTNLDDEFDFQKYLSDQGIYVTGLFRQLYCEEAEPSDNFWLRIKSKLSKMRETAIDPIERHLSEPKSSLLAGILFGVDRVFEPDFAELLRLTGTTHIIAASGYNVMVVSNLSNLFFGLFEFDFRIRRIVSIIFVWLFAVLAALSPSVVRAAIMLSIILFTQSLGIAVNKSYLILLTVAFSILVAPGLIWRVGYQLSLFATLGLIYLADRFELFGDKGGGFAAEYIKPSFVATFSVSFIMILNFGSISLIGLVANVLVLPLLETTMLLGFLGVLFNFLGVGWISTIAFALTDMQLGWFISLIHLFENWDLFVFSFDLNSEWVGVLLFLIWFIFLIWSAYLNDMDEEFLSIKYYLRPKR